MVTEFALEILLKIIKLARSTYYYQLKQLDKSDKNHDIKDEIQAIFTEHKGNYGYRRMTLELRNRGFVVNHKKVQRLMKILGLSARIRRKRKYSSYQGEVGKKADNLIQRQFEASKPMEKCYTDVTEFAIPASSQKLARSTYYYQLKQLGKSDKNHDIKDEIQAIFTEHKGNYGYRRMTLELRNRGFVVNHKKVQRLMKILGLSARIRRKRKYSSYQGEVGKKADNLIQRQFEASKPMEKCYTDVTEFAIPNITQKLYLSPVLDGFNSEIIAYNLSTSPNLEQVKAMLDQAFTEEHYENTILHSDQGWQYQHQYYHQFLEDKGIQPSMSRKGNSPDNGMMESFFGILKSEMFYGYEKTFHSLEQLEQAIVNYIDYYNNKRIKVKLKGLSPVQYRTKSFG